MAKSKASKKSDIIQEDIKIEGVEKEHVLKTLFDGDEKKIPIITSIGFMPVKDSGKFVSYVITSKGREILKIEVSEPDFRAIAEDEAKINFVNRFMSHDLGQENASNEIH